MVSCTPVPRLAFREVLGTHFTPALGSLGEVFVVASSVDSVFDTSLLDKGLPLMDIAIMQASESDILGSP